MATASFQQPQQQQSQHYQQPQPIQQYEQEPQHQTNFHDEDTEIRNDASLPPSANHSRHTSIDIVHPAPDSHAHGTSPITLPYKTSISTNNNNKLSTSIPAIHMNEKMKMESRREKRNFAFWYYRYVNPWIRGLLLLPILYFYMTMSAINTYRVNKQYEQLPTSGGFGDPQIEYKDGPSPPIPFALKDVGHENLYAAWGSHLKSWTNWANFTVAFFMIVVVVWLIIKRDVIRLTEFLVMEMFLFTWNAIAHVATSYPDPAYYQYKSCVDPQYHEQGNWLAWMATLSYCGDHMWSGHTTNTLVAIIMFRRIIWDTIGWNVTRIYPGSYLPSTAQTPYTLIDATGHHQWKWGYMGIQPDTRQQTTSTTTETTTTTQHQNAAHPQVQWNPDAPVHSIGTSDVELGNADIINQEKHMNDAEKDGNDDFFFRIQRSQYTSPAWVVRHFNLVWGAWTALRIALPIWHASLCCAVLIIRFHYTADVVVANVVTFTLACNPYFVQTMVRFIYRPNYWNYQAKHWWTPIYIDQPTNREQCNYEERVRRCGLGGLF